MNSTVHRTKVKICCISSEAEARLAIKYGASVIGLVGPMPSGPGIIANELIKKIADRIPSSISSFLLTSETSAERIIRHHMETNTSAIQLVDSLKDEEYSILRSALPNIQLIQVIHVQSERSIQEAVDSAPFVDVILLDSGNPNLEIKELGGTGRTHNWELSREIVAAVDAPVFLAGGLNSSNVPSAIKKVRPHGVDVCSGVRTDGKLDEEKLAAFFKAVHRPDIKSNS